jgi:hypothetical protein
LAAVGEFRGQIEHGHGVCARLPESLRGTESQIDVFGLRPQGADGDVLLAHVGQHVEGVEPQRILVGDLVDFFVGHAVWLPGLRTPVRAVFSLDELGHVVLVRVGDVTLEHVRRFNEVIVDRDQNEVVHLHYVLLA